MGTEPTVYLLTQGKHIVWLDRSASPGLERDALPVFTSEGRARGYVATFAPSDAALAGASVRGFDAGWVRDYITRKGLAHTVDHPGAA